MDFTELAAKAAAGDADAFINLIKRLENSLHFMAKSILTKDEDVADALQETILKAFRSVSSLREPKYFKTWIFRILINECHNIISQQSGSIAYAEVPQATSYSGDYEKVDLREAVNRLDEPQRLAVILHYFEDLPLRQVARVLDISESAVKMRLSRARDALQRTLPSMYEGKMTYGRV
ncbi:sigma-70 family RNA polymerase sigma factor [Paenibacillus sp. NEAU-GSW1]|uniref:sigma-70 family RNA polymerase sigma factor n=1 Tax=Paenibacillus sp. NEAU-GSW1 TaxID=2682486 RepID=UPI00139E8B6D|nr:sigma-70 family RNA polymerase sigma factor [Paenibacillus sp. NEAU-GSW1]